MGDLGRLKRGGAAGLGQSRGHVTAPDGCSDDKQCSDERTGEEEKGQTGP